MVQNPNPKVMAEYIFEGQAAAFERLSQIKHILAIERQINEGLTQLDPSRVSHRGPSATQLPDLGGSPAPTPPFAAPAAAAPTDDDDADADADTEFTLARLPKREAQPPAVSLGSPRKDEQPPAKSAKSAKSVGIRALYKAVAITPSVACS